MHKMTEFLKFAYELRKYDVNDDYSEKLIKEHVSIPVIYELVMANQFKDDSMEFNEFKLQVKMFNSDNRVMFQKILSNLPGSSIGFTNMEWLNSRK